MPSARSPPRSSALPTTINCLDTGEIDHFTMGILAVEVLLGSLTFTGSLVAFGKLQELIPSSIKGLPQSERDQLFAARAPRSSSRSGSRSIPLYHLLFPLLDSARPRVRHLPRDADRRRRHADGHLAAQFLRRPLGQLDGLRAQQLPADRRRRARRLLRPDPLDHHVPGDESLVHQRAVRPHGRQQSRLGRRCLRRQSEVGHGRGRGRDARRRPPRRDRARLRPGRRPSPTRRPRPVQSARKPRHRSRIRASIRSPAACRAT